jgi:UDP-N-acetylmuramate dehydrogenase
VIQLSQDVFAELALKDGAIVCGAGVPLGKLMKFAVHHGCGEVEFMMGIPAHVGGAVVMNAGTGVKWIGDFVQEVRVMSYDGRAGNLAPNEIGFAYRKTNLEGQIVLSVKFMFPKADPEETRKKMNTYNSYRMKTQDLKHPNSGCMFANPSQDVSAGRLIDEAGLKGYRVGGAQVSDIHGNFMINAGGATYRDALEVLAHVEKVVYQKHQIQLRRELQIIRP